MDFGVVLKDATPAGYGELVVPQVDQREAARV